MPLTAPQLDDRKFEDILREARLRIPVYAPEWTDFNESDPGITLLQLFAWLTEMMLYRVNQIPERNYIKFLQLLGMELRPAQPAVAHVTFTPKAGATTAGPVPAATQLSAQSTSGDQLIFETEAGLDLIAVPMSEVQVYDGSTFWRVTSTNEKPGPKIQPLGFEPQVGSALYLGFTPPPPQNPPAPEGSFFPQEMHFRIFLPVDATAGAPQNADEVRFPPPPPVTLVWEYRSKIDPSRWKRLNLYRDESAAFTREGYVLVEGPTDPVATHEGKVQDVLLFWIRVRLERGSSYGAGVTPEIDFIRPNTVDAKNLATVKDEDLGTGDGTPNQTLTLERKPVQAGSLTLTVLDDPNDPNLQPEEWTERKDFLASKKSDKHFVLNRSTGEIRFGDGRRHGAIPLAGSQITAKQYRYGGGDQGNVAAGAISSVLGSIAGVDKVINEKPAIGGRNEQTTEELKEQAPALLRSRQRAVTAEDFAAIAANAGGVSKATALAQTSPDHPGVPVPGAVTVVIVPDSRDKPPVPSSDLIRQVCNYLDGFRLLTTELYVRGPRYQAIRVEASVFAKPFASFDDVSRKASKALDDYLDPLTGKLTFGDDLFPTSLLDSILRSDPNVVAVKSIRVYLGETPHDDLGKAIVVGPGDLLYGGAHQITVLPFEDQ